MDVFKSPRWQRVPDDDDDDDSPDKDLVQEDTREQQPPTSRPGRRRATIRTLLCVIPAVLAWALLTAGIAEVYSRHRCSSARRLCAQMVYSPAQDAIQYRTQLFSAADGHDVSEYYGPPSDELDRRWAALWDFTDHGQWIPRSAAQRLVNTTSSLGPAHPDRYWVFLDVFHQVHCVDLFRKLVDRDYYATRVGADERDYYFHPDHLRHCVDHLRQHVMCHADVTPMVRVWDAALRRNRVRVDTVHTCRDFDAIRDWARRQGVFGGGELPDGEDWMDDALVVDGFRLQG